ncbi:MAG: hypothetical protein ABF247_04305, partial [Nonlabens sp.]|uniref:hypothetical protein n=1 Tax=Nonlabens sp. TaxID=1888209 RepID=UPI00321AB08B
MKQFLLFAAFCAAVFSNAQTTVYNADFSNNGDGFADHTSASPPATGPTSVGPFGASPNSWGLSYEIAPGTDTSANSFKVVSGELQSDDWGGQGIFTSQSIDLSSISSISISAIGVNSGANDNDFTYFYILDNGSRVETVIGATSNGDAVNYSVSNLDVSGNSLLVVGFEFSENGGGDGYDISQFKVTSASSSGNSAPVISNISNLPVSPTSSDAVTVSADVTDTDGVDSVVLEYGFSTGVYDQTPVTMSSTGDTYTGDIPLQADGTEVFYRIVATDSNSTPETATSAEQTYTVMDPVPAPTLIITEVTDPSDEFEGRFVELYNNGTSVIDFSTTTVFFAKQVNGNNISSTALTGTVNPGEYYVVANSTNLQNFYGVTPDLAYNDANGNGDDGYFLYVGGDEGSGTLFDAYGVLGQDGTGESWEYEDSRAVRNDINDTPTSTWQAASWTITSADVVDMTPGQAEIVNYNYDGTSWAPSNPVGNSTTNDNITIQSGSVAFSGDIDANTITVEDAATLDLGANTVNLTGNLTTTGTGAIDADTAILTLAGADTQSLNASLNLEDLIVNNANGAVLKDAVNLEGLLT